LNIYSQKQQWKVVLFIVAMVIVGLSFWYTSTLVKQIANEERTKARLWAEAIQNKASLVKYTNELFQEINIEERKKVERWAEATRILANANNISDYTFILKVVSDNTTVPVILTDEDGTIISHRNLDAEKAKDTKYLQQQIKLMEATHVPIEVSIFGAKKNFLYYKDSRIFSELRRVLDDLVQSFISEIVVNSASVPVIFTDQNKKRVIEFGNVDSIIMQSTEKVQQLIAEMESQNKPIEIHLSDETANYIFYKDSLLLTQLKYYPVVQFGFIGLFILISYWLFSMARKAEQNQVWVGMAKETAHQLGTPLSSLMAWLELFKEKGLDPETTKEIDKDIKRLETITDRFSKIGASPKLKSENVLEVLENSVNYMKSRSSERVKFEIRSIRDGQVRLSEEREQINSKEKEAITAKMNIQLFDWVIENLWKNALDAMNGSGAITIDVSDHTKYVYIDISDTGKGISSGKFKTVFQPGYTTKQRGWGLGLSLSKRIIENYHQGKIFVKRSEMGKGTTFRIVLNK